jgi:hypothetical protein
MRGVQNLEGGDAISPPGGFVGGNMDELVDVAIDPAGNVWVTNNWRDIGGVECFEKRPEATSTRCGGTGVTELAWRSQLAPRRLGRRDNRNELKGTEH